VGAIPAKSVVPKAIRDDFSRDPINGSFGFRAFHLSFFRVRQCNAEVPFQHLHLVTSVRVQSKTNVIYTSRHFIIFQC